jgi:hypothetical protein
MTNPFENDPRYLDVLKAMEFGGEGGGVSLYRVLPRGEAEFIWYSVGSGNVDDEPFNDDGDILGEYEDITEYLDNNVAQLAYYYLDFAVPEYRDAIFAAFVRSLREIQRQMNFLHPIRHILGEKDFCSWSAWQKQLKLTAPYDKVIVHSAFGENPALELVIDYDAVKNSQHLLDTIYMGLVQCSAPAGTYGKAWQLYDLINYRNLDFPHDDRRDRLYDAGVKQGGHWVVYGLG